jgi:hypothetical protein
MYFGVLLLALFNTLAIGPPARVNGRQKSQQKDSAQKVLTHRCEP